MWICIDPNIEFFYCSVGGWGTWICIDPNIEFFYCSVGRWGTWICSDPNIEVFYFSVRDGELGYVLTQAFSFSIVR